jgi:preprotein translocase SecF subunit
MSEQRRKQSKTPGNGSGSKRSASKQTVAPAPGAATPEQRAAVLAASPAAPAGASVVAMPRPPLFFQLIPNNLAFDYLRWRWYAIGASWTLIVLGLAAWWVFGMNYGIDFSGGTLIQVQLTEQADIGKMRDALSAGGIPSFSLQALGEAGHQDFLITIGHVDESAKAKAGAVAEESLPKKVERILKERFPSLSVRRVETVGPKVGEELKGVAVNAVLFSLGAILLYIWVRFQWRYSIGAVVATIHDVLIVLTAIVFTQREMTLTVLAAVLTVAGYSVNDTVVVFDRIRENQRRNTKKELSQVMNEAINQTLSRTLLTSLMTMIVVVVMFFFGGQIINDFAFSMIVGVIIGTYSSIFVASPVVYMLYQRFPPKLK